jgi:hypothetical protein
MILRILAMIAHEFMAEYHKLDKEPDHPDESVLSFSSALSPGQTGGGMEAQDDMSSPIGFNWAVMK